MECRGERRCGEPECHEHCHGHDQGQGDASSLKAGQPLRLLSYELGHRLGDAEACEKLDCQQHGIDDAIHTVFGRAEPACQDHGDDIGRCRETQLRHREHGGALCGSAAYGRHAATVDAAVFRSIDSSCSLTCSSD